MQFWTRRRFSACSPPATLGYRCMRAATGAARLRACACWHLPPPPPAERRLLCGPVPFAGESGWVCWRNNLVAECALRCNGRRGAIIGALFVKELAWLDKSVGIPVATLKLRSIPTLPAGLRLPQSMPTAHCPVTTTHCPLRCTNPLIAVPERFLHVRKTRVGIHWSGMHCKPGLAC